MAYTEEQIKEIENTFREEGTMDADEHVEHIEKGDIYPSIFSNYPGFYYFTNKQVIFANGIGLYSMHASYSDITNIKKSVVGPLLPFSITITAKTENGKSKNYKFSLLNRAKWLDYLAEKTGLSYS